VLLIDLSRAVSALWLFYSSRLADSQTTEGRAQTQLWSGRTALHLPGEGI